ncbi:DUF1672 family protein [Bifidobacterium xylocopae]|uniref:Uncharacterized protein n=1 Tax=Bifidobacterium xylocopae TaxID=2493119 RepID=A0A366KFQ3_9BIFI|nr:DUF1672 family protein [Bifidobacterium xylocopae]RBP99923.1 hypothetical protein CRD59_00155 [Bifidobacterium xylocopae]
MSSSLSGPKALRRRAVAVVACLLTVGLLGGCSVGGVDIHLGRKASDGPTLRRPAKVATTPVQEYTGQGFAPEDSQDMRQPVQEHEAEIKRMVVSYMKNRWHSDVTVNAVWPAINGAHVNVSCADPQFTVSVQVDMDEQGHIKGDPNDLWENVKTAIVTGLYHRAWQQECDQLNAFLAEEARSMNFYGLRQEAIAKTRSVGYESPWFYFKLEGGDFEDIVDAYVEGSDLNARTLRPMFERDISKAMQEGKLGERGKVIETAIQMYGPSNKLPPQSSVDRVEKDLTRWAQSHTLPPIGYTISLFSNAITDSSGMADGDTVNTGEEKKSDGTVDTRYLYPGGRG